MMTTALPTIAPSGAAAGAPAVLITGAGGFIARHLTLALREAGWRVVGTSRTAGPRPGFDAVYVAALGDGLAAVLEHERIVGVVHAALATGAGEYDANLDGTNRWFYEAQQAGARIQILLSSLSANPSALSAYGRAKSELESRFIAAGGTVLRMGVVVGEGGMFRKMVDALGRSPVVPLIDGGRQPVYVLGIDFLCRLVCDLLSERGAAHLGRAWNIQQPHPYPMREVMAAICRAYGLRRLLVPVPPGPVLAGLSLVGSLRFVRLPVSSANVRGLIQQGRETHESDYARFGYPERELSQLISDARERA